MVPPQTAVAMASLRPAYSSIRSCIAAFADHAKATAFGPVKQLDSSVTDLHSAADEGNQAKAEEALKSVESAFDQLKAEDPDSAFKGM